MLWLYFSLQQTAYQVDIILHYEIVYNCTWSKSWKRVLLKSLWSFGSYTQTIRTLPPQHCQKIPFQIYINAVFWRRTPTQFNFHKIFSNFFCSYFYLKVMGVAPHKSVLHQCTNFAGAKRSSLHTIACKTDHDKIYEEC